MTSIHRFRPSAVARSAFTSLGLLIGLGTALHAQTLDVLNARQARDYIYLVNEPTLKDGKPGFTYGVDEHAGRDKRRDLNGQLTLSGFRSGGVNIVLRYMNPIQYSWTSSETVSDDPSLLAIRQFLKSIDAFVGVISGKSDGSATAPTSQPASLMLNTAATTAAKENNPTDLTAASEELSTSLSLMAPAPIPATTTGDGLQKRAKPVTPVKHEATIAVPPLYAPVLRDWSLWLLEKSSCLRDSASAASLVNGVASADAQLYGTIANTRRDTRSAEFFRNSVIATLKALKDAGNIKELEKANNAASDSIQALTIANKVARDALAKVKSPDSWTDVKGCDNFANHTNQTLEALKGEGTKALDTRDKLLTDLAALNSSVAKLLLPSMHADGDQEYFTLTNVDIPRGKVKEVTVTVHARRVEFKDGTIQITEGPDTKSSFHVLEHQSMLFEFAPGLAYVEIPYPKYAPVQDSLKRMVVGSAGDDKQIGTAVAMLNITPNIRWGGISRMIGQIGIGTGKQFPLLLFGGGIRLSDSSAVTITAGGAVAFRSELSTLKLGDQVANLADIEKDLHYKISSPRFYIGIQRGLQ